MEQQSSASAAVDPDRLVIQHFEQGGANPQAEPIMQVGDADDPRNATFSIKNEDHTLGNALRFIIMRK